MCVLVISANVFEKCLSLTEPAQDEITKARMRPLVESVKAHKKGAKPCL